MAPRTLSLDGRLYDYVLSHSVREPAVLKELRAETAKLPMAMMQIGPEQGQFMGLLVELTGAKRAIEVGTFTGYSSLSVALAMPATGASSPATSARNTPTSPSATGPRPGSPARSS